MPNGFTGALTEVVKLCKPGASVVEVCNAGDKLITDATAKLFNKKTEKGEKIEKGIAFPTCVSSGMMPCPAMDFIVGP